MKTNWIYRRLTLLAVVVSLVTFGQPSSNSALAGCKNAAAPGVNWSGCFKERKILSGHDMTGANLSHSILTGSDLGQTNFLRNLALPEAVEHWSLTTLQTKLIKIGAKVVRHGRYITFQLAEVAVSRALLAQILGLIADLRAPPPKPA